MGLLSILSKGLRALFTPQSFKTGERFENYLRKRLFPDRYYEQLQRTRRPVSSKTLWKK